MSARRSLLWSIVLIVVCVAAAAAQEVPPIESPEISSGGFTYRFGVNYMFQVSGRRDYPMSDDTFQDDETFAWWRLRPRFSATNRLVSLVVEAQDTHSAGGTFASRKAWLDLLNAYVDVKGMHGWSFRAGRQQGDLEVIGRMVRTPDFAAVVRSFDVAQAGWQRAGTDIRALVFKPVDNLPSRFNRQKDGEWLWTVYGKRTLSKRAAVQSYLIARHNREVVSETGVTGSGAVYAWLFQATGPTPARRVSWTAETILERGHYATDDVRAWAAFLRADVELARGATVDLRYAMTSGDTERGDGVRGQYDTFYAAANYYGSLGLIRGSNVQSVSVGGAVPLASPLTLNWRYFNTHLKERGDLWYGAVTPNLAPADATSSFIGHEAAFLLSYQPRRQLLIRGGYFQFFPGPYATRHQGNPFELRLQIIGSL